MCLEVWPSFQNWGFNSGHFLITLLFLCPCVSRIFWVKCFVCLGLCTVRSYSIHLAWSESAQTRLDVPRDGKGLVRILEVIENFIHRTDYSERKKTNARISTKNGQFVHYLRKIDCEMGVKMCAVWLKLISFWCSICDPNFSIIWSSVRT